MWHSRAKRAEALPAIRLAAAFCAAYVAATVVLCMVQGEWDRRIAFESASALGTVGLSMGVTEELTTLGRVVICVVMFVGRVGPFALASAVVRSAAVRHPTRRPDRIELG